jgi:poly(3-hydroxybutyrate) depolymerase
MDENNDYYPRRQNNHTKLTSHKPIFVSSYFIPLRHLDVSESILNLQREYWLHNQRLSMVGYAMIARLPAAFFWLGLVGVGFGYAQTGGGYPQNPSCAQGGRFVSKIFQDVELKNVNYASAKNFLGLTQKLYIDVYQPKGDPALQRPLILYFHGGAFVAGDKLLPEAVYFCTEMAKRGYVCASVQYRLGAANPLNKVDMIRAVIRALQDARGAVQFMRKTTQQGNPFRIDPTRIYAAGYSAGAITALHLAYLDKMSEFQELADSSILNSMGGLTSATGNFGNISYKIQGVITYSGALGKASFIEPGDVPLIMMHGTEDHIVPYNSGEPLFGIVNPPLVMDGSRVIDTVARNQGVCSALFAAKGRDHVVWYVSPSYAAQSIAFVSPRLCAVVHGQPFCCQKFAVEAQGQPDNQICIGESITLKALPLNNNGSVQWVWSSGGAAGPTTSTITVTPLATTNYQVQGIDLAGCVSTGSVTVQVNPLPVASVSPASVSTCSGQSVALTASGSGGLPPYSYQWQPASAFSQPNGAVTSVSPTQTTTYTLIITDARGCASQPQTVTVAALPRPVVTATSVQASCWQCNDGSISASASGGQAPYSFSLNGGANQANGGFTGLLPGNYTLTITGANGCTQSQLVQVAHPPVLCPVPNGLSTVAVLDSTVSLQWTQATGAKLYQVEITQLPNGPIRIENASNWPYEVDTLYPKTNYRFRVRTVCLWGDTSAWSAPINALTLDGCVPPYYIKVNAATLAATISWDDVPHTTGYWVSYKSSIDLLWTDVWTPFNSYTFASLLLPFTNYTVRIKSDCSGLFNNSDWSGKVTFTTGAPRTAPQVEQPTAAWSIYPNPATDHLNVSCSALTTDQSQVSVVLIDAQGRTILTRTLTNHGNHQLEIQALPAGLYVLQLQDGSAIIGQTKIMKR